MIDIIIPIGNGSIWSNNELRYSLRSVERFLRGHGQVFIVGIMPDWITNVIHIPASDMSVWPAKNIMNKIKLACKDDRVSDLFLFMNDDHFLTMPFEAVTFPYFHKGSLAKAFKVNKSNYQETIRNTLLLHGPEALDFDIHTPILYRKSEFMDYVVSQDWKTPHGFCIKSVYCNSQNIKGTYAEDGKFYNSKSMEQLRYWFDNHPIVSIGDECLTNFVKQYLETFYPNKSKYEL